MFSTPNCEGFLSIKQALCWLYWRTVLRLQGAKRVEFHSFGKYQSREEQIAVMRVIARGECTPAKPIGDSKGLKPRCCQKRCHEEKTEQSSHEASDEKLREV